MMNKTKKYFFILGVLVLLLVPALVANAQTITGKLTGLTCLIQGYICPIDKADPMINLEKDFVVVTASGDYYFLTNIGLGLKGKYALQVVEVTGDVNPKYKTVMVKSLKVDGKVVWDAAWEEKMSGEVFRIK
ncbi:MAG: hypothetical protein ABSE95_13195 [Thermodesulfobacteriota bacterium]|jgi:hypothetical protein